MSKWHIRAAIAFLAFTFGGICWPSLAADAADTGNLVLNELTPDPTGSDTAEWIELYNSTPAAISTAGWRLTVNTRTTALPTHTIPAGAFLVLTKAEAKFTLTNTGATVTLYDAAGMEQGSLTYGKAPAGQSYAQIGDSWTWTNLPTPGQANRASAVAVAPERAPQLAPAPRGEVRASVTDVYTAKSGAKLTVTGTITLPPGELGASIAFLDGLQLNLAGGSIPKLAAGDTVRILGSVSHTQSYGTRLTVKSGDDIVLLKHGAVPQPTELALSGIDGAHEGALVTTNGTVAKVSGSAFSLDEGDARLGVTLKNRELAWPKLRVGDTVRVTGFVTVSQGEPKLWARAPQDVTLVGAASEPARPTTINLTNDNEPAGWQGYAILGALILFLGTTYAWQRYKLPPPLALAKKILRRHN